LVTPGTLVFVNGLGLGCDGYGGDFDSEVAKGKTDGYDGELDSDVAETPIPSDGYNGEPDIGKTDGYDGELDSDVDRYDGELDSDVAGGKTDGYDGELDIDVAETSIPSDGYDGEPNIDLADMTVRLEVDSDDACMVLAVSNMATFCLESNFSNGEPPPHKTASLKRDKDT
jgi:hypothetical protein